MLLELQTFCGSNPGQVEVVDVDADAQLRTRFGHKVPVLLLDGLPVCHGQFDADEVRRLLCARGKRDTQPLLGSPGSASAVLPEPVERLRPPILRRFGVIARTIVRVETMLRVRIDIDA